MNLYVGNLNYRVKESELKNAFEEYGTVESVRIIRDRETRRSKGFGFVDVPDDKEGEKMLAEMNGKELQGREIVVKVAEPRA